ncbi:MAG TPA: TraR/DksA C4-type zinc finger protein [Longimicrobiales bacterium]|nr:TraR/DksA C4-type zinc finger protein [Longimicrobiales bacterium]
MITPAEARERLEKELRRQISTISSGDEAVAGWMAGRASDGVRRPWETSDDLELTGTLRDLGAGRARALALALVRVEKGTYGLCTRCGDRIAHERLEVLPEIETCRDCTDN